MCKAEQLKAIANDEKLPEKVRESARKKLKYINKPIKK